MVMLDTRNIPDKKSCILCKGASPATWTAAGSCDAETVNSDVAEDGGQT